ncbi:CoA transferase subunit A [Brevibacillus ginsengisoli]|uniref:CoA transferase subunit A n=1 Tax=Brevibacillus ginsengisoli TaxID=363854 RepID=UPI003CF5CC1F
MHSLYTKFVSLEQALESVKNGTHLICGGFGGIGSPHSLIEGILQKDVKHLKITSNDAAYPNSGIGRLISAGLVKTLVTSHIGSNPYAGQLMTEGLLEVIFVPQGILAEKIRAGGVGIPALVVDIGLGTIMEEGKQIIRFNGISCLIEPAITADVGIVYAKTADTYGNLIYDKSARNNNPLVAMAADITIAEVEEIVPVGELDPELIATPGIYVDYIVGRGGSWIRR